MIREPICYGCLFPPHEGFCPRTREQWETASLAAHRCKCDACWAEYREHRGMMAMMAEFP